MNVGRFLVAVILLFSCGAEEPGAKRLAFPGADGYGRFASGGRGGRVIEVTSLEDSGPGTLRQAVTESGPRTIVFRISGTIALKSDLLITSGDLTIAGQTAPGGGICLKDYPTVITARNVIVQHMRFRMGDEHHQVADALCAMNSENVIIDHCSMSWGNDEVGTFYDNSDFTLQWCIISESLYNSVHPKGPHGFGGIWGGERSSFHHNLLAHHSSRNPRFQGGRNPRTKETELVDFRNNVIYNWGYQCAYGGEGGRQNVVANYFKPGPASRNPKTFLEPSDALGRWYVAENVLEGSPEISADNWSRGVSSEHGTQVRSEVPFPHLINSTEPALAAYERVLREGGATLPRRDDVDARIVRETSTGTATFGDPSFERDHPKKNSKGPLGIIDRQATVGGWPELGGGEAPIDSDKDGLPDDWEKAEGLDPANPADGRLITASGYSNLERYLHSLDPRTP